MKLSSAIKKSKKQIVTGWIVTLFSILILFMSSVKFTYQATLNDTSVFRSISNTINSGTVWIYQKTIFAKPIWKISPTPSWPQVFSDENIKVVATIFVFMFGIILRDSGLHLSQRIYRTKQRAEEKLWENSLTGEKSKADIMSIEIELEPKDSWYTRPAGIIILAIIGGYIVNLLTNITGI